MRKLYYGDNLDILRTKIAENSIDLCYIDPPFNSKKKYFQIYNNIGKEDQAQTQAFTDTWRWDTRAVEGYQEILTNAENRFTSQCVDLLRGLRGVLKESGMLAYLISMALRITEIQRVLNPSGSFYLHCDPTASHYLKLICDAIFCARGGDFINEIIWHYRKWPSGDYTFQRNHDVIFFYTKSHSRERVFNQLYMDRSPSTLKRFGTSKIISGHDGEGNRLPSETEEADSEGVRQDDVWDISRVAPVKQWYPTEKPEALLDRIIRASTQEGDTVLDAYCGCGTTVIVAEQYHLNWIGIDITYNSIGTILKRIEKTLPGGKDLLKEIHIDGIPKDVESARALAHKKDDRLRKEFEKWAVLTYTEHRATINDKKSADWGIDGISYFWSSSTDTEKIIFQVKSGNNVGRSDVAELKGNMEREGAKLGVLITLKEPTTPMRIEEKSAGMYHHPLMGRNYPVIQIVTIKDMIENGKRLEIPLSLESVKSSDVNNSIKDKRTKSDKRGRQMGIF